MPTSLTEFLYALERDVVEGARAMLGCYLIRGERRARIVEVEAYRGRDDPGSRAFRGPTPRNQVMFGPPGHAYVYFTYGNHWMLNVVAESDGIAGAVLIRAAEPMEGIEEMRALRERPNASTLQHSNARNLLSGPGKLTAAFGITGQDNGIRLFTDSPTHPLTHSSLHIRPGPPVPNILVGTRIGLAEGRGRETPWRFADADALQWVSHPITF